MSEPRQIPFEEPTEVRRFPFGRVEVFDIGGVVIGRNWFEPGWHWDEHVRPIAGTPSCQYHHMGVTLSGHLHVRMDDGTEADFIGAGVTDIPPGHDAWVVGDEPWVSIDFAGMRSFARPAPEDRRILASVLFTDIADSTGHLGRLGDGPWRELLERLDTDVRFRLEQSRGRLVKSTGDGYLALFDGAARAAQCALAIVEAARALGLSIRAGVHTGEVEVEEHDVKGVAIHLAARIMAAAEPGEVLVSTTTRDLAAGSTLRFQSRGAHALKGFEGTYELLAATSTR